MLTSISLSGNELRIESNDGYTCCVLISTSIFPHMHKKDSSFSIQHFNLFFYKDKYFESVKLDHISCTAFLFYE